MQYSNANVSIQAADLAEAVHHCAHFEERHSWRVPTRNNMLTVYVNGTPEALIAAGLHLIAVASKIKEDE